MAVGAASTVASSIGVAAVVVSSLAFGAATAVSLEAVVMVVLPPLAPPRVVSWPFSGVVA